MKRHPNTIASLSGILAIGAGYVYFLIFAQFAFLRLAESDGLAPLDMRWMMGIMGLAGVLTSLGIARLFGKPRPQLLAGFALCAVAALLALSPGKPGMRCGEAALIGIGLGITTVGLAASAPLFFAPAHRGLQIGLGTGLAYGFCNIPAVFAGTPVFQTWVAIGACAAGIAAIYAHPDLDASAPPVPDLTPSLKTPPFAPLVALFLALVWLDSGAFYTMQNTPELNRYGWATPGLQWTNAAIHLGTACIAGLWLDRGGLSALLATAYLCLAVAAGLVSFPQSPAAPAVHWLYATGVSLYSTALVSVPSLGTRNASRRTALVRAGILYAVAGWIGSALGIGMAQDLHRIPVWFLGLSGGVISCSLYYAHRSNET